jgi:HK97 gp10 family phage protein
MEQQLADMRKAFKAYGDKTDGAIGAAMTACTIVVEGTAVALVPVDTGLLKKSINRRVRKIPGGYVGEVGTNVEYAPFQEFGTSRPGGKAQPFLTPALKINRAKIKKILATAIAKVKP